MGKGSLQQRAGRLVRQIIGRFARHFTEAVAVIERVASRCANAGGGQWHWRTEACRERRHFPRASIISRMSPALLHTKLSSALPPDGR